MTTQKYDYAALKLEYISADPKMSIRELCVRNGIDDNKRSSVQRRAKAEGWDDLREKALVKTDEKVLDQISTIEAKRRLRKLQVQDNAMELIDESIEKMRADMRRTRWSKNPKTGEYELEPVVTYRPEQVVQLIDRIEKLFDDDSPAAEPTQNQNLTQINFNDFDPNDPGHRALASSIVERTRGSAGARGRAAGASPLPSAPGSGEDQ